MSKIIFFTNSYYRKPEFQLSTSGFKTKGGTTFRKQALNKEAQKHLHAMFENYQLLRKVLPTRFGIVKPVKPSEVGDYLEFEAVNGISLDSLLLDAVIENRPDDQRKLLQNYLDFTKSLCVDNKHGHSTDESFFGTDVHQKFSGSKCIQPGLFDINFDNLIYDGKTLTLIDYEWCFEGCLPEDMAISRALFYFCSRYSSLLKKRSESISLLAVSDELVVPEIIYKEFGKFVDSFEEISRIEWQHVQLFVTGRKSRKPIKLYKKAKKYSSAPSYAMEELTRALLTNNHLSTQLEQTRQSLIEAESRVKAIESSRSYKLASKLSKTKRKLTKG